MRRSVAFTHHKLASLAELTAYGLGVSFRIHAFSLRPMPAIPTAVPDVAVNRLAVQKMPFGNAELSASHAKLGGWTLDSDTLRSTKFNYSQALMPDAPAGWTRSGG